jgi:hypothetical protein
MAERERAVEQVLMSQIQRKTPPGGKVSFDAFLEWAEKVLDAAHELGLLD